MPMSTDLLLAWLLGYLLGSVPFGLLLTRLAGKGDVRSVGSGNIGATNVLRAGGKGLAAATLLLDALKGTAAVLLAGQLFGPGAELFAATGAMLGHLYPAWLRFRGGKGVATLLGVLIPLLPVAALVYALVWLAVFLAARFSAVAGLAAAASAPASAALLGAQHLVPMLLGFALLVVWKHRTNIARLKAGTEPRIGKTRG